MKEYLYETHLHTAPVSKCARATVRETLAFYKSLGYAGVFITNHFLNGNINCDRSLPYEEKIEFYFSDYEEGARLAEEIGISVFLGVEQSYGGTDFLIYGLDKAWYLAHPEAMEMDINSRLTFMAEEGALIIQAHPYREASYIECIRLFPRVVHGAEIFNANQPDYRNNMTEIYVKQYELIPFAGSDNHLASGQKLLGGMEADSPVRDVADFIERVKNGEMKPFRRDRDSFFDQ